MLKRCLVILCKHLWQNFPRLNLIIDSRDFTLLSPQTILTLAIMESFKQTKIFDVLRQDSSCLLLLSAFIFLTIAPIIYWGTPNGYDLPQHYQFAFTYFESIQSGNFLPSWAGATNYGFGDIGIRFYPPLAHYFLAFTQLLTGDWMLTTWLNIWFWMWLGSIGAYFLAKEWLSPMNAFWVGILYAIAPYHLSQIYQLFLYSEFVAAAILPFCFLFLTRICRNGNYRNVVGLSISASLLILSHIPTTIIAVVCLGLYAIIILDWKKLQSIAPKLLLSGLMAVLATSFYWVKLVTELSLVSVSSPKFSTGLYSYTGYFFPMFFNATEIYFAKQMWLKDFTSIATLLFILPLAVLLIWKFNKSFSDNKKDYLALSLTAGFAFFMSSSLSSFLWANLPFLQKIQFPFRWLSVATLLGVLCFMLANEQLRLTNNLLNNVKKYSLVLFLFGLFLFDVSQVIIPSEALTRERFAEQLDGLAEKESFDCWWTIWSKSEAFQTKEKVVTNNRQFSIIKWDSELREFEVAAGTPANARIATFYYPHWQATVNGQVVKIERNDDGTMAIPVPAESAKISVQFVEPYLIKIAKIISLVTWILLLGFGIMLWKKRNSHALELKSVH